VTVEGASSSAARIAESVATGAAGAALAGLLGWLIHPVVAWVVAPIALLNGLISGWRGVYSWRRREGWIAFVLDSTWAVLPVVLALIAHLLAAVTRTGEFEASLSSRQNRHVYRGGARLKPRFALTLGNVISNARDVDDPRRRRLITDHEAVHTWQARWFGPVYIAGYIVWFLGGSVYALGLWLRRHRVDKLSALVESCAYYSNPFEWWAYSRDDHWRPPGMAAGVGWKKPLVRPLAQVRAESDHR
jgi:hypothetical protein